MVTFTPVDKASAGADTGAAKPVKFIPVKSPSTPSTPSQSQPETVLGDANAELHSASQGVTLGWGDEIDADSYAAIVGAENAYRKATGKPVPYGMSEARHARLHDLRKGESEFHSRHPLLDDTLGIAGGMATPGLGVAGKFVEKGAGAGVNFAQKAVRSGLTGAGVGAVAGASDENDRLGGAERGAEWGAGLGTGLHLFGSFIASGLPKVAEVMKTPSIEAWKKITSLFGADNPKATPEEIAKAHKAALEYVHNVAEAAKKSPIDISKNNDRRLGKPVLGAEAIGRPGVSALAAVGRRSGETPDKLESTLRQRAHWAPSRIESDLSEITGVDPAAIHGKFDEQLENLRDDAKPLYDVAYAKKVDSPKLRDFLTRDAVKKALVRARRIASNEGIDPETVGLVLKNPHAVGAHADDALQLIEVKNPTMRTWDYIKRGLDDELEDARDKVTGVLDLNEERRAVLTTLTDMRHELFAQSPEYENAVAHGGEAPRQQEAYRSAPELMKGSVSLPDFKRRLFGKSNKGGYTPAQMEALKGGFISDVYNRSMSGRLRLKDMQNPLFIEKARAILGFEPANKFLEKAESEMRLQATGNRMMPGNQSATMEFQAADKEREDRVAGLFKSAWEAGRGNVVKAFSHLLDKAGSTAKTIQLDEASRNEVGRLLMLPPKELARVLYDYEKTRTKSPAKSFVRKLAEDPTVLDAGRRLVLATVSQAAQHKKAAAQ